MATVKDVAERAGVSIATVSRVLNKKGRYTKATEQKVYEAVQELKYTVNLTAKSLKTGLTGTIGILVNEYYLLSCPEILEAAIKMLKTQRFSIEIVLNATLEDSITLFGEGKYDGLLLIESSRDDRSLRTLIETKQNFVLLGGDTAREDVNLVEIDYFQGGYITTKQLISLGHTHILFIEDNPELYFTQEIKRGFLFALDENGIQYKKDLLIHGNGELPYKKEFLGYSTVKALLNKNTFSAVLTTDDRIACAVLRAASEEGSKVPDHISVIGFGDLNQSEFLLPPLTTVKTPTSQMGELGAEILVNNIKRQDNIVKRVKLKTHLVKRNTLARRSKGAPV